MPRSRMLPPSDPPVAAPLHGRLAQAAVREIVEQLEEEIVLGRLHPRERLVEDALILRFGAKRHSVREALAQLERIGLAERQPNRGAIVREWTPQEAEDIYAVREIVEVAAARLVRQRATRALIQELKAIQRRHDAASLRRDLRSAFRLNIEFHRAFFGACGNAQLVEAIEAYGQKAHGIRSFSITQTDYLRRSGDEHWSIVRALEEGDGDALIRMCREHIHVAKRAYIDAYHARFPDRRPVTHPAAAAPAQAARRRRAA